MLVPNTKTSENLLIASKTDVVGTTQIILTFDEAKTSIKLINESDGELTLTAGGTAHTVEARTEEFVEGLSATSATLVSDTESCMFTVEAISGLPLALDVVSNTASTENIAPEGRLGILKKDEVPVVLFIGQSNTDGRGVLAQNPRLGAHVFTGNTKIFQKSVTRNPANADVNRTGDGQWTDIDFDNLQVVTSSGTNGFGPELPFVVKWEETYPDTELYVIKSAIGGTSLADDGAVDNNWSNEEDSLWELTLNYIFTPAIQQILLTGKIPKLVGILWGQGETDAGNQTYADAYETNLTDLIQNRINVLLGFDLPKFMIAGLSNYPYAYLETVKNAEIAVASSIENAVYIASDGNQGVQPWSRFTDGVGAGRLHYDANGLINMGESFFEVLDFYSGDYVGISDYEFIASALGSNEKLSDSLLTLTGLNKTIAINDYPIDVGNERSLSWIVSDDDSQRSSIQELPAPAMKFDNFVESDSLEIIYKMFHDGDDNTKPGFWLRANEAITASDITDMQGYLIQNRRFGVVTCFRIDEGSGAFTAIGDYTNAAASGVPYYYKLRLDGNSCVISDSPDGIVWTEQLTIDTSEYLSGNLYLSLFNGLCGDTAVVPASSHAHYPILIIRKL